MTVGAGIKNFLLFLFAVLALVVLQIAGTLGNLYLAKKFPQPPVARKTYDSSNIVFTPRSSLANGAKLGRWNSRRILTVTDFSSRPLDGESYIDLTMFESTVKNLNLSLTDQMNIKKITSESVKDFFVNTSDIQPDFFNNHFTVKSIKVYFQTDGPYKKTYTLSDGELKMMISYAFDYDWFHVSDGGITITTTDGQGVGTDGPFVTLRLFDFVNGSYHKMAVPEIIPNFDFPKLNNTNYDVFVQGFPALLPKQQVDQIIQDNLPDSSRHTMNLHINDSILYPELIFSNYESKDTSVCKGRSDPSIALETATCKLNASSGEVTCKKFQGTCQKFIVNPV